MFTTIVFILVLSLLVFVHELGHFWTAKKCGLIPKEFGFGFPPRIFGFYKDKEGKWKTVKGKKEVKDASDTIYSINAIPIGGFVMLGEDDDPGSDPNHFNNKPVWQRMIIILAGVTMNIILAFFLFTIGFMIGLPQQIDETTIAEAVVTNRKVQIMEVMPDTPASKSGVVAGDYIISIDGTIIENVSQMQAYVNKRVGQELVFTIKNNDKMFDKVISPRLIEETGSGGIGVAIMDTGTVKYPIHLAIVNGAERTYFVTVKIIYAFYDLFHRLFLGQGVSEEVGGPIRIAEMTGQVARMGLSYLINFTAILSINLAIINVLPVPALDGGRALFLIIEAIKGRPMKKELEGTIHYIGFVLLMILMVLVVYKDIARLVAN